MNHYGRQVGNWYEWPKPDWVYGFSKRGFYFSTDDRNRDAVTMQRIYMSGKHADFHWKMDNPQGAVIVD